MEYCEARLSSHDLGREQAERVHFSQGDACNLKPKYEHYDLVLASNLIDRLREPARFLRTLLPGCAAAACWCSPAPTPG